MARIPRQNKDGACFGSAAACVAGTVVPTYIHSSVRGGRPRSASLHGNVLRVCARVTPWSYWPEPTQPSPGDACHAVTPPGEVGRTVQPTDGLLFPPVSLSFSSSCSCFFSLLLLGYRLQVLQQASYLLGLLLLAWYISHGWHETTRARDKKTKLDKTDKLGTLRANIRSWLGTSYYIHI